MVLEKLFIKVIKVFIKTFQASKKSLKIKNDASFYFKNFFSGGKEEGRRGEGGFGGMCTRHGELKVFRFKYK